MCTSMCMRDVFVLSAFRSTQTMLMISCVGGTVQFLAFLALNHQQAFALVIGHMFLVASHMFRSTSTTRSKFTLCRCAAWSLEQFFCEAHICVFWHKLIRSVCIIAYGQDCFKEALKMRGYYEQYLYPKMTAEQKAFVVPGLFIDKVRFACYWAPCRLLLYPR